MKKSGHLKFTVLYKVDGAKPLNAHAIQMGCHLILRWVCNSLGDNLRGWKVSTGVGWCKLACGSK